MALETPLPRQAQVIAKHLRGRSKTQIASELGMSRNTVVKILDESEIEALAQESKSILICALPDSARTIANAVRKNPTHAWELLDRTGVMPKVESGATNVNVGLNFADMPNPYAKAEGNTTQEADQPDRAAITILPSSSRT